MQGPCKGCCERAPGCHSRCEKYREFRAILDEKCAERALVCQTRFVLDARRKTDYDKCLRRRKARGK